MTIREKLAQMSNQEIAEILCDEHDNDCSGCIGYKMCVFGGQGERRMSEEYILKQDASDWLKQYGQDVLHGKYKFSLMYIWKNIMDLPSADVVPVIRCRDCKNHDEEDGFCTGRGWPCQLVPDDGFCDKGKRREEQTNDKT